MAAKDRPFTQLAAQICGFDDKLNAGLCPICGKEPKLEEFEFDEASKAEFEITGICWTCQQDIFRPE